MAKTKYIIVSGFLGAGKTTSMLAFADVINEKYGTAGILANDLGAENVVDAELNAQSDVLSEYIGGDCICYIHDDFINKVRLLEKAGANVVMSDIPGCGIGSLDHVYLETKKNEGDEYELLPFITIVDPERLRMVMPEGSDINYPEEMEFLLDAQLKEADVIVLNKIDTVPDEKAAECVEFLKTAYNVPVMKMSALKGDGVAQVVDYFMTHTSAAEHKEIGYGSEPFVAAENRMSWYNRRAFLSEKNEKNIDFNAVFTDIFEQIRESLKASGDNVGHLKAFASGEGDDFFKASLTGIDYDIEYTSKLEKEYTAISFVLNVRAIAQSEVIGNAVDDAFDFAADKYNLKCRTFFLENFGMMEEGKGNGGRASRLDSVTE